MRWIVIAMILGLSGGAALGDDRTGAIPHAGPSQAHQRAAGPSANPRPPAPHASFPAPVGGPVETPPARVETTDLRSMAALQCEQEKLDLQQQILALQQQLLEARRHERDARARELAQRYMLTPATQVNQDGTIVRQAGAKK